MAINVFEGARRLLLVIQVLWVLVVMVIAWSVRPSARLELEVTQAGASATPASQECLTGTDAWEWVHPKTALGSQVDVTLCFRAKRFPNGSMLVPFRVDETGKMWGNSAYSESVRDYTSAYAKSFTLQAAQESKADKETLSRLVMTMLEGLGVAAAGWGILWLVAWVIGWIVRGFVGIPRGSDIRPQENKGL